MRFSEKVEMRILTVADFFYPYIAGGSAIVAYQIMRQLVQRGHEVTVVTRLQNGRNKKEQIEGMDVHFYDMPSRSVMYPLGLARSYLLIRELFAQGHYDVVNMHHASSGLSAEFARKAPSLFCFHGPWHKEAMANDGLCIEKPSDIEVGLPLKYRIRKRADQYILQHCTQYFTLSDYMRAEALAICPSTENKQSKIPGGVDINRFHIAADKMAIRKKLRLPEDKILLLTVRRLVARMGLENLLDAMKIVEDKRDDIILIIGGKGELWDKLNEQIRSLQLKNTILAGFIDDEVLPAYYQTSDLFIMPSVSLEGYGLSTVEALSCGTPVLGTPVGGTAEILSEVIPDYILPNINASDIAKGILDKVDHLRDPQLSARVRGFAEQRAWGNVANDFEKLLREVVT